MYTCLVTYTVVIYSHRAIGCTECKINEISSYYHLKLWFKPKATILLVPRFREQMSKFVHEKKTVKVKASGNDHTECKIDEIKTPTMTVS
jgi:hypothetical protein